MNDDDGEHEREPEGLADAYARGRKDAFAEARKQERFRRLGIPDALAKAFHDSFSYALGLGNGQVIAFESARLSDDGQWVHLTLGPQGSWQYPMPGLDLIFERGIDVRVADIVWVAGAPWGS